MVLSSLASFRGYCFASLALTTAVITHGVYSKRFFYRTVVYLSLSKFAILAVGNMALVSFLLVWRLIQAIFLGELRFREVERLHLRARDAIIECCFALTIFREEFNSRFLVLVTTLLLLKSLHWLAKDRIEFLEEQPLTPTFTHVRLVGLMALLFAIDARLVSVCAMQTFRASNGTMLVLFAFEFTVLLIELISNIVRYILHVIDLYLESRWEAKGLYSFYNELLSDMCHLSVYVAFFVYVQIFYTFPFHIIRDLYLTFSKFQKRCSDFLRYRRVMATMNELFADATEEELAAGDRTCIICREEMRAAKKLNCGHMFHARCLQSWLKRQLSCPTCRSPVDVSETAAPAGGNGNAGRAAPDAAPGAAPGAAANGGAAPGAAAAAGGVGNMPPWAGDAAQGAAPGNGGPMQGRGPPPPGAEGQPGQGVAGIMNVVNTWWNMITQMARVDGGGFGRAARVHRFRFQRPPHLHRPQHMQHHQHPAGPRPAQHRWPLAPPFHAAQWYPGYPAHPGYVGQPGQYPPPPPPPPQSLNPHHAPPPPHHGGPPFPPVASQDEPGQPMPPRPPHPPQAPHPPQPGAVVSTGQGPSEMIANAAVPPSGPAPGYPGSGSSPTLMNAGGGTPPPASSVGAPNQTNVSQDTPALAGSTRAVATDTPLTSDRAGPPETTMPLLQPTVVPGTTPPHVPVALPTPPIAGLNPMPSFDFFPPPGYGGALPPRPANEYPLDRLIAMQENVEAIYAQVQGVSSQTEILRRNLQEIVLEATASVPVAGGSGTSGAGPSQVNAEAQHSEAGGSSALGTGLEGPTETEAVGTSDSKLPSDGGSSELAGSASRSGAPAEPTSATARSSEADLAEVMRQRRLRYLQHTQGGSSSADRQDRETPGNN